MKWKKVSDEMPPLNKQIILGSIKKINGKNIFTWDAVYIYRPYDIDQEYNPSLYKYTTEDDEYRGAHRHGDKLARDHYWMEVQSPEEMNEVGHE